MALLHLLKGAESISSLRDRETAATMALNAIVHLLDPLRLQWWRRHGEGDDLHLVSHWTGTARSPEADTDTPAGETTLAAVIADCPEVGRALAERRIIHTPVGDGFCRMVFPFFGSDARLDSLLLAECRKLPSPEQEAGIFSFLRFYANYLALLDYSELDTLTGLHNRKAFDDYFERLLNHKPDVSRNVLALRRRATPNRAWLAILDIDHFKKINDTWGHLFGDETLLRFSRLLKQSFRNEDQLFRFGGEEFIVILRAEDDHGALMALERFRHQLAMTEFPQVGRVTCSIGFTRIDTALPATDILGRADEALYYAKSTGRNRTCLYEALIDSGRLEPHHVREGDTSVDFDIDALFV